jgi:2-amino-4-hydroxy-6-hydroxymethyldihydropteridine diphosphokinase
MIAYLSFGSNQGDRLGHLQQALRLLIDHPQIRLLSASSFYETEPVGFVDQPWFVNAAVALETTLPPDELLGACQAVEQRLGRKRDPKLRFGPRSMDIDILFYGDEVIEEPDLIVPHPRLHQRASMLVPLLEIDACMTHPLLHQTIEALHNNLEAPEEVLLYGTRPVLQG